MAWTAPMTAVAGQALNAADWNTHVRDNFNETAPAKATASGTYFVGNGANSIVERFLQYDEVDAFEDENSTSYTNLTTVGPTVSVQTGAFVIVHLNAKAQHNMDNHSCYASVEISGATTQAASDDYCLQHDLGDADNSQRMGISWIQAVNPGLNTFTVKYRVNAGTGEWSRRQLSIQPY